MEDQKIKKEKSMLLREHQFKISMIMLSLIRITNQKSQKLEIQTLRRKTLTLTQ
jgi:hypothetical protein